MARQEVLMCADIRYHDWQEGEAIGIDEYITLYESSYPRQTPAHICAEVIAATRNIAATWDVVRVVIAPAPNYHEAFDVTAEVKEAYDALYTHRRAEFVRV